MTFSADSAVVKDGDGVYAAELSPLWAAGGHTHGGYLLAIITRAALAHASNGGAPRPAEGSAADGLDPLVVSAQFLRSPVAGPAVVRTATRRSGRTLTVVTVTLEQDGRPCVDATVTCGVLPDDEPRWSHLPDLPAEPPADAIDIDAVPDNPFKVASMCLMRMDAATAGFAAGRTDLPPLLRVWVQPLDEPPDPLFALVAADISPPVVFNLGNLGWAPTVQLTAILRARPAPGWLRVQAESSAVHGRWFDEDHTVIDSTGRLVCQARQLAIGAQRP
jgi:acyl-coenzyme A thioesterase PaaI-like protein